MATKKQFDMVRLVAETCTRFQHQFKMPATVEIYLSDCKKILGDLTDEQLKTAYDTTIKKWRSQWAPTPIEILDNAPVPFIANKNFKYDRDLRAYAKDNRDSIEHSFRQAFTEQIHKAENNGWIWTDDLIKFLTDMQAWYDFDKRALDILTPEGRVSASKYTNSVNYSNPGRSGEDTFMRYVNNRPKEFRTHEKTGPWIRPGKFFREESKATTGGELFPVVDEDVTDMVP